MGNQGVLGLPGHLGGLCEGLLAVSRVLSTPETKWELGRVGDTWSSTLPQVGDGAVVVFPAATEGDSLKYLVLRGKGAP